MLEVHLRYLLEVLCEKITARLSPWAEPPVEPNPMVKKICPMNQLDADISPKVYKIVLFWHNAN